MRMDGSWRLCDDGMVRPIFRGTVRAADGRYVAASFLADTAADRTVLSAELLGELALPPVDQLSRLQGVGGSATSIIVNTEIRLLRETGQPVSVTGSYAAFTDLAALDMSVLGRDITNLFGLIVDRRRDIVCLLGPGHDYDIRPT